MQQQKVQERKDRTKRLCKRAGLLESLLPDTIPLTDEQFKAFLEKTLITEHSRHILTEIQAEPILSQSAGTARENGGSESKDGGNGATERRSGEHRAAHPCRCYSKHTFTAGADRKSDRYQAIGNLKAAAKMLNFLQQNQIMDMAGLEKKLEAMYSKQFDIRDKLKPIERRLKVLDEHIKQADIYLKYKGKKALPDSESILFTAASNYLKGVMNGKTTLPLKAWKAEYTELTDKRKTLNQRYVALKDEVREVEQIRRNVYDIMREETRREQPTRKQDMEL